jgi:hypothetical protein
VDKLSARKRGFSGWKWVSNGGNIRARPGMPGKCHRFELGSSYGVSPLCVQIGTENRVRPVSRRNVQIIRIIAEIPSRLLAFFPVFRWTGVGGMRPKRPHGHFGRIFFTPENWQRGPKGKNGVAAGKAQAPDSCRPGAFNGLRSGRGSALPDAVLANGIGPLPPKSVLFGQDTTKPIHPKRRSGARGVAQRTAVLPCSGRKVAKSRLRPVA